MSKKDVEQLFAGLEAAGITDASGLAFTLESAKAREKLQEFALAQPDNYQLLAVAGLYALGCRNFSLTCDADDFLLRAELSLPREPFCDLWSFVSRGSSESLVIGCRLLAMAILTSVRLDEMVWTLESRDEQGGWSQTITVRRGLLRESPPQPLDDAGNGVILWAKRKAVSQILRRYLTRWWKGASYPDSEAELLRTRLFLPAGASLLYNGRPLLQERSEQPSRPGQTPVWAVLETGQAPPLVDCAVVHRLERDYSLAVLLCRPGSEQEPGLPGKPNHAVWIWNGLHMDATLLGADLTCMRAFVWAPELRPDLSFTGLVDNRDKQALERSVRSLARELLDRFVRALTEEMLAQTVPFSAPFFDQLSLVKQALAERVDPRKDWRRLASLNRALVECPLVVGSGADGVRRWYSAADLQREFTEGRVVATFRTEKPPSQVEAWPERPTVLYTVEHEWLFLNGFFRQGRWRDGREVVEQIERLQSKRVKPAKPASSEPALFSGSARVDGHQLAWSLTAAGLETESAGAGGLQVCRSDGRIFFDRSLGLPPGFQASVEADWERSFHGTLLDRDLASALSHTLLAGLAAELAAHQSKPPSARDEQLSTLVLSELKEPLRGSGFTAPWLVVTDLAGKRRSLSPQQLDEELQRQQAPLFFLEPGESLPLPAAAEWPELPLVVAPLTAQAALSALMARPARSGLGFVRLKAWTPRELPLYQDAVWSGRLDGEKARALSPALRSLEMTVLVRKDNPQITVGTNVTTLLRGYQLQQRRTTGLYPSLHLVADWEQGWPDANGQKMLGGLSDEEMSALLSQGSLALARELFAELASDQVGSELAARIPRKLLGTWMFDLLSEPVTSGLRLFLLADGRWVSLSELSQREGEADYFPMLASEWGDSHPDAVYLPGPMADTITLFCDWRWNRLNSSVARKEPPCLPSALEPEPVQALPEPDPEPEAARTSEPAAPSLQRPKQPTNGGEHPSASPELTELPEAAAEEPPASPATSVPGELLIEEYRAVVGDGAAVFSDFERHLTGHLLDEERPGLYAWEGQRLVLGAKAIALLHRKEGRLMLLSSLHSALGRTLSRYDEELARQFHQRLLHRALGGGARRPPTRRL